MHYERNLHCPRCGATRRSREEIEGEQAADQATTIDDAGDVVADDDQPMLPLELLDGWVEVGSFDVCPDCVTEQELWAAAGACTRCGRDPVDDEGEEEIDGWTHSFTVCSDCSTEADTRETVREFLEVLVRAAEQQRGEGKALSADHWTTAVAIMLERAVPNKLHWMHPIDPLADDPGPWDPMPKEIQQDIVRCSNLGVFARTAPGDDETAAEIVAKYGPLEELPGRYEALAEATARAYVVELRRQRARAIRDEVRGGLDG